ncbi:glycosyltransferase family 4 protein [Nocardioides panacisoli]|uniref:Glycosyltransferase family 4 protein n=1 Tax=Nocardioides panacisoli TaxID=627624 RepID=A0ABP7IMG4_9ACTN
MTAEGTLAGVRAVVVNWRDLDHSLAGGSEIYAWECARALREGGADVEFLTAREPGSAHTENREGISVRRTGGPLTFYPAALLRLLRRRRRIDLVIDPSCGIPSFSPLVLRRRTPVVLVMHHVHQDQFGTHFPAPVAVLGRWLERVAMRTVYRRKRVVAVSRSTAEQMREQLGWTGDIGLLPNGADLPAIVPDPAAVDPDRVVVLGRLVAHKRVDLVIRTFFDVQLHPANDGRRLHLDIIGQGPERERLERIAAAMGLEDRVTFHGHVDEETKGRLLSRAAVHVCASDAEGWGQAVIDAAGYGVPTLARDVPGLRDSVRPLLTGWLVPDSTDPEEVRRRLSDALASALADGRSADVRAERATACRAWAAGFDWSRMRDQTRALAAYELAASTFQPLHSVPRDTRVAA